MNERFDPQEHQISHEQKQATLEKVSLVASYDNQPIDNLGSYETRYEVEDGYVSIYMPVMAGHASEKEFVDEAVRVLVRHEDELENGLTIVRTEHYTLHVVDHDVEYDQSFRVVDSKTGQRVGPVPSIDMDDIRRRYDLQTQVQPRILTLERLAALDTLLDSLDPTQRF